MSFYIIIFVILSLIALVATITRDKIICSFITFILIVSVQGLRWRTGTDWDPYYHCFLISNIEKVKYVETGYYLFNKIIRSFTDSYTIFLIIESCIITICQWKFAIYFNVRNVSFVLFSFFCGIIFPVRFTLAVAIFLLGYRYMYERNFFKFLIVSIVAISIHQLIALAFPLYFVVNKYYNIKSLYIVYGSCCILGLLSEWVFGNILNTLNLLFAYLPSFSQEKALAYLNEDDNSRSFIANLISFSNGALFIYILNLVRQRFDVGAKYNTLLNMYVFGLSLSRVVLNTIPYLARINVCCSGGLMVMLLVGVEKSPKYKLIMITLLILYLYSSYNSNIDAYPDLYIPYYSIFTSSIRSLVY